MSSLDNHNQDEHDGGQERWLVSYADFITLMFAFFAVLYATSEQNVEKTKEFQESLRHYLVKAGAFGESGAKINPGEKGDTPIVPPIQVFKQSSAEASAEFENTLSLIEEKISTENRKKYLLDMSADDLGIRISLAGPQIFSGQTEKFNPEAMAFLNALGPILANSKRRVVVEGHVAKGQKGQTTSSWEFASSRAINFLRFLEVRHGIQSSRLSALSHGDSQAQSSRAELNDRIEIVLIHEDVDF